MPGEVPRGRSSSCPLCETVKERWAILARAPQLRHTDGRACFLSPVTVSGHSATLEQSGCVSGGALRRFDRCGGSADLSESFISPGEDIKLEFNLGVLMEIQR